MAIAVFPSFPSKMATCSLFTSVFVQFVAFTVIDYRRVRNNEWMNRLNYLLSGSRAGLFWWKSITWNSSTYTNLDGRVMARLGWRSFRFVPSGCNSQATGSPSERWHSHKITWKNERNKKMHELRSNQMIKGKNIYSKILFMEYSTQSINSLAFSRAHSQSPINQIRFSWAYPSSVWFANNWCVLDARVVDVALYIS